MLGCVHVICSFRLFSLETFCADSFVEVRKPSQLWHRRTRAAHKPLELHISPHCFLLQYSTTIQQWAHAVIDCLLCVMLSP